MPVQTPAALRASPLWHTHPVEGVVNEMTGTEVRQKPEDLLVTERWAEPPGNQTDADDGPEGNNGLEVFMTETHLASFLRFAVLL